MSSSREAADPPIASSRRGTGPESPGVLDRALDEWSGASGASTAGLWWIQVDTPRLIAGRGEAAALVSAVATHPEWLAACTEPGRGTPAPGAWAGWTEAELGTCRHVVVLPGECGGRAVLLLTGSAAASPAEDAALARHVDAHAEALAREAELAHLRRAVHDSDQALEAGRRIFFSGLVVAFCWRNDPDWSVEYVSPNVREVLGYSAEEWLSGHVRYADIVEPADLARVAGEVADASERGLESFTHEDYRVRRRDGQLRWLYDHTSVLRDGEGRVTHYLGYILDVTDRRRAAEERLALEGQMRHTQKLESLGVLTGGLAHDFNNLLVGVLGNANLALEEVTADSPLHGYLSSIDVAARRAADLVRQMLAYSGKGRFHVEPVDLRQVIEEMTHLLEAAISKKVLLRFQFDDAAPVVTADATQIRQVVMNLITNASDAIGTRNGLVTVRTGVRQCTAEFLASALLPAADQAGSYAFLEVTDTGSGMDRETQGRIFDPFFTTKFAGRGLGLSAVQGIVRGHAGALFLRSSRGAGTTFRLYFPLRTEDPAATDGEAPTTPRRRAVLLVDDEESVRDVARKMLESLGLEVVEARDGSEALDVFNAAPLRFDLALIDLTMPNMGGEECLRELRRVRPDLRVVLSSGYTEEEALHLRGEEESTGFLQKPYDTAQLRAVVARLIEVL
ncbi:MAG: response regulator [Planctomycetes bacterium]|nr:response regulator [Planctomycetota bacterium]